MDVLLFDLNPLLVASPPFRVVGPVVAKVATLLRANDHPSLGIHRAKTLHFPLACNLICPRRVIDNWNSLCRDGIYGP